MVSAATFARMGRAILADLGASVGAIIFGAAIALVGQMYHLSDDFAAGMLLWAAGALAAAALTGRRTSAHCRRLARACRGDCVHHLGREGLPSAPLDLSRNGRRGCDRACVFTGAAIARGKCRPAP
jgi:hypothetical protein